MSPNESDLVAPNHTNLCKLNRVAPKNVIGNFLSYYTARFAGHSCTKSQFRCSNGECLKPSVQCDGDAQCLDGSDELNCACLLGQFMCVTSEECVQSSHVCDGKDDCPDGSDEKHCSKLIVSLPTGIT